MFFSLILSEDYSRGARGALEKPRESGTFIVPFSRTFLVLFVDAHSWKNVRKSVTCFRSITLRKHLKSIWPDGKDRGIFTILTFFIVFVHRTVATAHFTVATPKFPQLQPCFVWKVYSFRSQKGPCISKHYSLRWKTSTFCKIRGFHRIS